MSFALLAIYACGDDDANAPDDAADGGAIDGALIAPEGGSSVDRFIPPQELPGASLALGEGFGCIVSADHAVYCWGRNDFGQLGKDPASTPSCGAYPCSPTPVKVEGFDDVNVIALTAGRDFACALDDEKHGWCWGNNSRRQLAVKADVKSRFKPEIVTDGTAQIVAAGQHACILDTDGFLHCWGDNDCRLFGDDLDGTGTLGVVEMVLPQAKAISLGPDAMCTVSEGASEVYCWGADHKGSLGHPLPDNAESCAGGAKFDPSPKRWVSDKVGHILADAADVHVGSVFTCVRKNDGSTFCAGDNSHGGLGQGLPDGDTHDVPLEVPALKAAKVFVSGETACAISAEKLLCWGDARYGQMETGGPGTSCSGTGCRPLGFVIPGQENLRDVALSPGGIGTIKSDVSVWVWGRNDSGETGVAPDDPANTTCAGGTKCIATPRQMTNVPALK